MSDFHPLWAPRLNALLGIPVIPDDTVPAGTATLVHDAEEPRHITGVRTADHHAMAFTAEQIEQIRDHYRAMDERAGQALDAWRQLAGRLGLNTG